jgi:outer membrane protein assembly factor BamA
VHAVIIKIASRYLGSTVDFAKLTLQTGWFFPVYKNILFAFSARGGIEGWFQDKFEIPISERFFLGGASSIRGYNFETVAPRAKDGTPTGGDSMALFNLELRFPLPYEFGFVTFIDAGNAWLLSRNVSVENFKQTGTGGLRYGAGVGLRYNTPVGPFRLDYGFKLNPLPGESRGQLHFTIGQAF